MATFEVKAESLPERCEICHQADLFDRETGYCARCSPLATQAAAPPPTHWQPQPFTPAPPFTPQPPAVPHPFAPPPPQPFPYPPPVPQPFSYPPPMQYGAPQPYPYQPPVSPLAPTLPRVVHEDPNYWARQHQPLPRLHYRYIGPTTVSEWVRFRDTALGGLVGALPMAMVGMLFLLNGEPTIYFALIAEAIAAGGVAGFRVGNLLRSTGQRTAAQTFRQRGIMSGIFVTFPMMAVLFLFMLVLEMRANPNWALSAIPQIAVLLIPITGCFIGLNILSGYLAARMVEFLERRNLVATTTTD